MRQFVYQTKSQEDPDTWGPMLIVERSFFDGANKEWKEVVALWEQSQKSELKSLFDTAMTQAKDETVDLLAERIPNIESVLGGLKVSFEDMVVN